MELRVLEYFVALAEEGSFTRAAARCHVAQPSISHQLKQLEREVGEQLLERGPRGVVLTSGGRTLLPYARAALSAVASAGNEFAARAGVLTGNLNLGVVDGLDATRFPAVLGRLHQRHPRLSIRIEGATSAPLVEAVSQGRLDAAVIAAPLGGLPAHFEHQVVLREEIVAIARVKLRDGAAQRISPAAVPPDSIISYHRDSGVLPLVREAFKAAGVEMEPAHSMNDPALHVALVRAGMGVAVTVASEAVLQSATGLVVHGFQPPAHLVKVLIWRRAPEPGPALRALLEIWEEQVSEDER
jgi:DNA-binding transcriptional LysR family regulator